MKVVIDIEANGLENPTKIWCIVCKDVDTGEVYVFEPDKEPEDVKRFLEFSKGVESFIGHNWLGYDYPVLRNLIKFEPDCDAPSYPRHIDTLVVARMANYSREGGHSVDSYGEEFGLPKLNIYDFSRYTKDMLTYCKRDVEITLGIYKLYLKYITSPYNLRGLRTEHKFTKYVNLLHSNGFCFNIEGAKGYLDYVQQELLVIDKEILKEFPPRLKFIREVTPKVTKYGTINRTSIPRVLGSDLSPYSEGASFSLCGWQEFNPSSHKQLIDVLSSSNWSPVDKTDTHIEAERELSKLKKQKKKDTSVDLSIREWENKLCSLRKTGWKINENNLSTLPERAPAPARALAQRILLEARRRTLTEWLELVQEDGRIHGRFYGIGAWTHRMAHRAPNTANIPNEFDTAGKRKLLGKEMRSLWCAPENRLLVGVDAEGIQLRIFAHYINDPEFTDALVKGKKDDKTDPHSLNQRILGRVCKSRAAAKRFIYALLLGAGIGKLSEILGCDEGATRDALARLMERYTGFQLLKDTIMPRDAKRGWFRAIDGRQIPLPGMDEGYRRHLCMSGYLQAGEAIVMKEATILWHEALRDEPLKLVNFVHDEWQTETPDDMDLAMRVARLQADSLRIVGEQLKLRCPLAGSYWNDDLKSYTIAKNWAYTH